MLCTPVFAENTIRRIGDERVEYYNGRIVGIGNKTVTYNNDGTIRRIGDERVEYYNGRIVGIGNKTVTYNND